MCIEHVGPPSHVFELQGEIFDLQFWKYHFTEQNASWTKLFDSHVVWYVSIRMIPWLGHEARCKAWNFIRLPLGATLIRVVFFMKKFGQGFLQVWTGALSHTWFHLQWKLYVICHYIMS
jgi:hypothetical protein